MRAERLIARALRAALLPAILLGLSTGCATRVAPRGWSPKAEEARREGFGGWMRMTHGRESAAYTTAGELLAISDDSVFVLVDSTLVGVPLGDVSRGLLETYDPDTGHAAAWTTAGAISTITHGWWLVISAPLWVLVGSSSTGVLSHQGRILRPNASWADMRLFARFPQGLPPGLDRSALRPRPFPWRRQPPTVHDPRSITNERPKKPEEPR